MSSFRVGGGDKDVARARRNRPSAARFRLEPAIARRIVGLENGERRPVICAGARQRSAARQPNAARRCWPSERPAFSVPGTDGSLLREAAGLKIGVDAYVYMLLASVTFQLIRASRSPRREPPAFTDDVLRSKKWRNPRIPAKSRCQALKSIAIDY